MIMKYKSWIYILQNTWILMSGDKWIIFHISKNINISGTSQGPASKFISSI